MDNMDRRRARMPVLLCKESLGRALLQYIQKDE